jgi:hypothetical protein
MHVVRADWTVWIAARPKANDQRPTTNDERLLTPLTGQYFMGAAIVGAESTGAENHGC